MCVTEHACDRSSECACVYTCVCAHRLALSISAGFCSAVPMTLFFRMKSFSIRSRIGA